MKTRNLSAIVGVIVISALAVAGGFLLASQRAVTEVTVTHAAVTPTATTGTGLGTVRTFYVPIDVDGVSADGQYLTGTLTTLAEGGDGDQELRSSNLVFVFGDEANQLVVGGISLYPSAGATLAVGEETVRPVVGGSGSYSGARGDVVSTNLGGEGWSHVFRIRLG